MGEPTPNTAATPAITRAALRAAKTEGWSLAWRKMLAPLLARNPLPFEYERLLDEHFKTPYEHRPSVLKFHGLEISDYARYRDETHCFVCAALCDQILTKQATGMASLTARDNRFVTGITAAMSDFLHGCPALAQLLVEINLACNDQDAWHFKTALIIPSPDVDGMKAEQRQFLATLQQELQRTCPAQDETLLLQSLDTLTLAGWLSAKPVVLDYLRLVRDWVTPTTKQQIPGLQKLTDDVSRGVDKLYTLMMILRT